MNNHSGTPAADRRQIGKSIGLALGLGFLSGLGGPGLTSHPDERLNATIQRWASIGGWVARTALGIDLLVRALVLRQDARQYWDIGLIWMVAMMLSSLGMVRSGLQPVGAAGKWSWKTSGMMVAIIALLVPAELWYLGGIGSIQAYLGSVVLAGGVAFVMQLVMRAIYGKWERRALGPESEDE